MRDLNLFSEADIEGEDVLVKLILDLVDLAFEGANLVEDGGILLKNVHLGEEHTDALFEKLKLLLGNGKYVVEIGGVLLGATESLENHELGDGLALVGYLVAAGCDGNDILACGGKIRSLCKGVYHSAERTVSGIFSILNTDTKRAERFVNGLGCCGSAHKVFKVDDTIFHVLDLFYDHSVNVTVSSEHIKFLRENIM